MQSDDKEMDKMFSVISARFPVKEGVHSTDILDYLIECGMIRFDWSTGTGVHKVLCNFELVGTNGVTRNFQAGRIFTLNQFIFIHNYLMTEVKDDSGRHLNH